MQLVLRVIVKKYMNVLNMQAVLTHTYTHTHTQTEISCARHARRIPSPEVSRSFLSQNFTFYKWPDVSGALGRYVSSTSTIFCRSQNALA